MSMSASELRGWRLRGSELDLDHDLLRMAHIGIGSTDRVMRSSAAPSRSRLTAPVRRIGFGTPGRRETFMVVRGQRFAPLS
jgi:hypothetical protein